MTTPPPLHWSPAEIARFDAQADQFWAENGSFAQLHKLNPVRLAFIEQWQPLLNEQTLAGTRTLDVGCGGGILAEAMSQAGAKVTGIDRAPRAIEAARAHAKQNQLSIDYHVLDCQALIEQSPEPFQLITCMEVLEHVPAPETLIALCNQLLAPGGTLVISTINRTPMAWFKMIGAAEHLLRWVPHGTHHYTHFIRPSELERACRKVGLQCLKRRGIAYHPLNRGFYLVPGPGSHYLAAYRSQKLS